MKNIKYFKISLLVIIALFTIFQAVCGIEVSMYFSDSIIRGLKSFVENTDWMTLTIIVRKVIQFFLYVVFGFVLFLNMNITKFNNKDRFNKSMIIMIFIAMADELLQGMVGRSSSIFDILFSSISGIIGIYIAYLAKK